MIHNTVLRRRAFEQHAKEETAWGAISLTESPSARTRSKQTVSGICQQTSLRLPFRLSLAAVIASTAIVLAACSSGSDDKHGGDSSGGGSSGARASAGRGGSSTMSSAGSAGSAGVGVGASSGAGGTSEDGGRAGIGGAIPPYSVNDVTYLFPLPTNAKELSEFLGLATTGSHGPLLSPDLHATLVAPNFPMAVYDDLKVVALRLDPCASQTIVKEPGSCQSEIRLVLQPIRANNDFQADDGGVHLIYRVARAELDAALAELVSLRDAAGVGTDGVALGPHPAIVKEGLSGAFAQGVNAVIRKYLGTSNLFKVTDFDFDAKGLFSVSIWNFAQFEKNSSGTFAPSSIPTQQASAGEEQVSEQASNFDTARDTGIAQLDASGYPQAFLKSSNVSSLDSIAVAGALNRLAALENPTLYSNTTIDCGSCHLTSTALPFFEQLTHVSATDVYKAPAGQNTSHRDDAGVSADMLHALGYSGKRLQVSQRVINESARVADWLSNGF